ncbi:MAG: lysophospholipid acyltransferase family protein [Candidatus Saccharibacteria bacterium]|nr:lysophospholipid acyltransferase family protein [Moraxellaceae bacterium]
MNSILQTIALLPLALLRFFARAVAVIMILMPHTGIRWTTRVNLILAFPELKKSTRLKLERQSVTNQCLAIMESIKCWGMPSQYSIDQIKHVEGLDILKNALADPKGMIAVVPHLGTWEMMNAWLNQFGSPTIMYKPSDNAGMDKFMLEARQRLNATLVPTDEVGVRAIFKILKKGGFTIILPDHVPEPSGGIYAPFFGHEVMTTTLVSKLAQKTKCAVIALSCIRNEGNNGFTVVCEAMHDDILNQDLRVSVSALNQSIENMIRRAPEQYVWSYRRFKDAENFKGVYRLDEVAIHKIAVHQKS